MKWRGPFITLSWALCLVGCTTVQSRTTGFAQLADTDYDTAFKAATSAAVAAGFTIASADKESGLITAKRGGNAFLTYQDPAINIVVQENKGHALIQAASTVGGQLIDYGTTESTIEDFCAALRQSLPAAQCVVQ